MRRVIVSGMLVVLAATPAAAQQDEGPGTAADSSGPARAPEVYAPLQTARIANDHYSRSHDYDLLDQRIALRDFDWDSTSFAGRVTTTLAARRPGLDSVILDAGADLSVQRVRDDRNRQLRSSRHGDTLVVFPADSLSFGDTLVFTIDYRARVKSGRGLTFIDAGKGGSPPQQIWSQGEAMDNHYWFPTYDFPNDKETWTLRATVPERFTAVSNGRLVSDRRDGRGARTMEWRQDEPSATYLVSLVVAPLVRLHDEWKGVPVDYYVYPGDSTRAARLFKVTPDMIDYYSSVTGVPYPWDKYAQTTVADFFGGMENVSATTLVDWLPDDRAYQDRPWYRWILIPHELAHQWFGDYVTTENWANTWLNEGFAEFMPGQYWGDREGPRAADDYYLDEYDQYTATDRRRRTPLAAESSNNIYPKGALVLRMLKRYLGPEAFWASIHRYLEDHALEEATTDDLRQAVLDATGQDLDWFWGEWMYSTGYPVFRVSAEYDSAASTLRLRVAQTQHDTAATDSSTYVMPDVFRMPVTVRVGTASGDVVRRFQIDAREQTLRIPGLPGPPTMVVFDDRDAIVKGLDFRQPTAWLARELAREPELWNRRWAVQQLARRTDDSAAAAALANAATGADVPRIRMAAARALGGFPDTVALPPLTKALGDSSARVRRAALQGLAGVGGDRASQLARRAFREDSSYAVRAAALGAAVRIDSTGARSLVARGLRTSSYRDEIQNAALSAIALLQDDSFLPAVDSLVEENQLAPQVLGVLARKSQKALDALARHLRDGRRERKRVLEAFQKLVPPERALPALRNAEERLKDPEAKSEVRRVVQDLEKQQESGSETGVG